MMFNTLDNCKKGCAYDMEQCPLVRFKDPGNYNKGILRIQNRAGIVSELDHMWLKSTYPWQYPPKESQKPT